MDGCGRVAVPSDTANVWMSEMDITNLLARVKETMGEIILAPLPDFPYLRKHQ